MSDVFAKAEHRSKNTEQRPNNETVKKLLEENSYLLTLIGENFNKGKVTEAFEIQKALHRNLVYLSCLAYPDDKQPLPQSTQQQ